MSELTSYMSALLRFSPAQHVALYDQLQPQLDRRGLTEISAYVDRARAHDLATSELEARWNAQEYKGRHSADLTTLDPSADRMISGVHDVAQGQIAGLEPTAVLAVRVGAMLDDLFPAGIGAVTKLPYVEQAVHMETCADKLTGQYAPLVQTLGMTGLVARFVDMTRAYRAAVTAGPGRIAFAEVEAMRARGHVYLIEVVALITAAYHDSDDPLHARERDELLALVRDGNESVRRERRLRQARASADAEPEPEPDAEPELEDAEPEPDIASGESAGEPG